MLDLGSWRFAGSGAALPFGSARCPTVGVSWLDLDPWPDAGGLGAVSTGVHGRWPFLRRFPYRFCTASTICGTIRKRRTPRKRTATTGRAFLVISNVGCRLLDITWLVIWFLGSTSDCSCCSWLCTSAVTAAWVAMTPDLVGPVAMMSRTGPALSGSACTR